MVCPITQGDHKERRQKSQGKNIMACPIPQGGHNYIQLAETKETKEYMMEFTQHRRIAKTRNKRMLETSLKHNAVRRGSFHDTKKHTAHFLSEIRVLSVHSGRSVRFRFGFLGIYIALNASRQIDTFPQLIILTLTASWHADKLSMKLIHHISEKVQEKDRHRYYGN